MSQIVPGIVRGGKIELMNGPELEEGQRVQVVIGPAPEAAGESPEEGIVITPLDDPSLINLLARIRRDRPALPPSPSSPGRGSAAGMLADDPTWDEHLREVIDARRTGTYRELSE